MPRGGRRPGAGRKSDLERDLMTKAVVRVAAPNADAEKAAAVRTPQDLALLLGQSQEDLVVTILSRQTELINAMIDLAVGVVVEDTAMGEDGEVKRKVYASPPDRQAISWLLEQAHGKATQKVDVKKDTTIHIISNVPRPAFPLNDIIDTDAEVEDLGDEEPTE